MQSHPPEPSTRAIQFIHQRFANQHKFLNVFNARADSCDCYYIDSWLHFYVKKPSIAKHLKIYYMIANLKQNFTFFTTNLSIRRLFTVSDKGTNEYQNAFENKLTNSKSSSYSSSLNEWINFVFCSCLIVIKLVEIFCICETIFKKYVCTEFVRF